MSASALARTTTEAQVVFLSPDVYQELLLQYSSTYGRRSEEPPWFREDLAKQGVEHFILFDMSSLPVMGSLIFAKLTEQLEIRFSRWRVYPVSQVIDE